MVTEAKTPATLLDAMRHFTPDVADDYIRAIKWPTGVCCPVCGSVNVGRILSRRRYQCREKGCRKQFSTITGTIMESTHLRGDQWIAGVWMIVNCKNGVSSCEIARAIGCKQQSAWHLLHRVRHILQQEFAGKFGTHRGAVEADSTFVGGLIKWMNYERAERTKARGGYGKAQVHAVKDRRSSTVRAVVAPKGVKRYAREFVWDHVAVGAHLYTDEGSEYKWAEQAYTHRTVNHMALEFGRGVVHVNGLECFFNCLRRGLKGTYIAARQEHLAAYVDEQVYRFNHRKLTDWERFDGAMRKIVGKRLTYSALTDGATR